jgi:hypothetical protein
MPNKKNVTIGFLLAAVLSFTASTALAQRSSPIAFVPNSAVAVGKINWTVVRQDNYFRAMFKTEEMERALSQLNVTGDQITDLVVFSGINSSRSGTLGGILRGSFRPSTINARLASPEFTNYLYKGQRIYTNGRTGDYSALLRSGLLAFGTRKGVEGVIDVEHNPRLSVTREPPFNSILSTFVASRRPISFVMGIPLEYQTAADVGTKVVATVFSVSGLGPLGFIIGKIGFPHALGFSMERQGATFPTHMVAQMKDATSAALISGTLNLAQTVNLSMLSNRMPPSDREMLKNISVTRTGALLSIKMALREKDLPPPPRR